MKDQTIAVYAAVISAVAAIAAAGIAAFTSWSDSKKTATQKIAEFRVDWIAGFRRDASALLKMQYEIA